MSVDNVRERFLIALAKFLGENPIEGNPLSGVLVCADWFLLELLKPVLPSDDQVSLTFDRFNQLMLACGRELASIRFYRYFFDSVSTIQDFEDRIERFRVKAMWLFGNFQFAYKRLATVPEKKFDVLVKRTELSSGKEFFEREEFLDIETIPEEDLGFLGYVSNSTQKLANLEAATDMLEELLSKGGVGFADVLHNLGSDKQRKISAALAGESVEFPAEGSEGLNVEGLTSMVSKLGPQLKSRRDRQVKAREIGLKNTQRYLTLPYLDVYVATSMRSDADFIEQHKFLLDLFRHSSIRDLKLRYFDPTISFDPDRIKKGLIECLMLRRANVTIYLAGPEDTMGKDSELAATLAQGKPVIVYVAAEPRFVPVDTRKEPVDMDRRANTFRVSHPLGLQIDAKTGVAHGIIVVRRIDQCASMLRKVLLHDLDFSIEHEGGNFLLMEKETKSVLRVVTDDAALSHSFWAYFKHTDPEPDI